MEQNKKLILSDFPIGEENPFGKFFIGKTYLYKLADVVPTYNVTFEPGARNNWHIHESTSGGGQLLICISGQGWYQQEGQKARLLSPGDIVEIPANVKHWHGATKDSYFQHIAIEIPGENNKAIWCEPVNDEEYDNL